MKPLLLIILDGWGYRTATTHNAIAAANTPVWDKLWSKHPHCLLHGSGNEVGLPPAQMGNSEVGHLNMGAGRIVYQDICRIDKAIDNGDFFDNAALVNACQAAKHQHSAVHIMGLLSPGGVHSHENHIIAMLQLAAQQQVKHIYLHAFLDGRDTPPRSAGASLQKIQDVLKTIDNAQIASICGRYYAMDRDNRWDRTQTTFELLVTGHADYHASSAAMALQQAYQRDETDEFVKPTAIHAEQQAPITINDCDAVIYMNFRADRARQLTRAFIQNDFDPFKRASHPPLSAFVSLTEYDSTFDCACAFAPIPLNNVLGACLAQANMHQLRIAETEKYAHVTFFFNGGVEQPFPGEQRHLITSPDVATYDLCPEMSAIPLTNALIDDINQQQHDVIICNYANADMVGHSGNFPATIKAIEVLDQCIGRLVKTIQAVGGEMLITADHGNAELMFDETTQQNHTAHSCNPVPLVYVGRDAAFSDGDGALCDIAPTMLSLLNLPIPVEMTGKNLLELKA